MDVNGKVAVVTGASSGMGLAVIHKLVKGGARVAIFDLDEEKGKSVSNEIGASVIYINVDVSDENSVAQGVAKVKDIFGAIHICVNCAGIATGSRILGKEETFPLALWQKTLNINLTGTFNVLRLCAEQMALNEPHTQDGCRGVIINTASIAAFEGQVGQSAYSASKGGIVALTLPAARELANVGIRVNAIAPGLVDTPMFDGFPQAVYDSLCRTPLFPQRLGRPEDIANLVAAIVENDYINGECIRIDGGLRMQAR